MGAYVDVYLGKYNLDEDSIEMIGPYIETYGIMALAPLYSCPYSRFSTELKDEGNIISVEEVTQEKHFPKLFHKDHEDNWVSHSYFIVMDDEFYATPMVEGYIKVEDSDTFHRCKSDPEYLHWNAPTIYGSDYIAGLSSLQRDDYTHIAYVDIYSIDFIKYQVFHFINQLEYVDLLKNNEAYCIIFTIT